MTAQLVAFASVLAVSDVSRSLAFYTDQLGFKPHFVMGDPPDYAIVERGAVSLHLMPAARDPHVLGQGRVYVFVDEVDALQAEFVGRTVTIEVPAQDFSYGMREMSLRDPDGNRLTFATSVAT